MGSSDLEVPGEREPTESSSGQAATPRQLARIVGTAVAGALAVVTLGLVLALWGLGLTGKISKSIPEVLDLVKLGFALVAGIGGTVGLVLAYQRHLIAVEAGARERANEAREDAKKEREEARKAREEAKLFNERFGAAAGQLDSDKYASKLAGVYAMAKLADDWDDGRQTCINVLCANLRRGWTPRPEGNDADPGELLAFQDNQKFRHTIIAVITARLRNADSPWQGCSFDFHGADFDGGDFSGVAFSGATVDFRNATFSGGAVDFIGVAFSGGTVHFHNAAFSGGTVHFLHAAFSGGAVDFGQARFSGAAVDFLNATFFDSIVHFSGARFSGGTVTFRGARFSGGTVNFTYATFSDGTVNFPRDVLRQHRALQLRDVLRRHRGLQPRGSFRGAPAVRVRTGCGASRGVAATRVRAAGFGGRTRAAAWPGAGSRLRITGLWAIHLTGVAADVGALTCLNRSHGRGSRCVAPVRWIAQTGLMRLPESWKGAEAARVYPGPPHAEVSD